MTIKQLNAAYLINEDRILFRFNALDQAEYRLWLTRRVTLFILAASTHLLTKKLEQAHSPDAAKAVNEFEKSALLEASKTANAGAQTYESGTQFPLGFDPLLVIDVSCSLTKNGEKITEENALKEVDFDGSLSIEFLLPGGANLNLCLPENMMRAMCVLLDQLRQQAGWGEGVLQIKNTPDEEQSLEIKTNQNISIH